MNKKLLAPKIQQFIQRHLNDDLPSIILKGSPFPEVSIQEIAQQIEGKRKAKKKLPSWFKTKNILYPKKLNLEQSSSETTAKYKASLVNGDKLLDLTGGFGVDSFFFSKKIKKVVHCELNKGLSDLANYNFELLNENGNVQFMHGNGIDFLEKTNQLFDWIYVDPSRRSNTGNKIFRLEDCEPNLPIFLPFLFQKSKKILLKTSPLLDINAGITALKNVEEIHVVAVSNEVKELLWILSSETFEKNSAVKTIHFNKGKTEKFESTFEAEKTKIPTYSKPLNYLYEPNPAIMKSGLFNSLSEKTGLPKLHANSHLYTSKKRIHFPGRAFKIEKILPFKPKIIKQEIVVGKANIATRNFPKSVAQIKKELGFKDGGSCYLFFTTNLKNQKIVLVCKR